MKRPGFGYPSCWISLLWLIGCTVTPSSVYPPEDFRLELEYRELREAGVQVVRRAVIDHQGLVIVREAERSLRSADARLALPVFERLCVYRLHPRSIRSLSRWLAQRQVHEIRQGASAGGRAVIKFDLTYNQNLVELVARDGQLGQLRALLRKSNAFLPAAAGFPTGDRPADHPASQVQDVPPFVESGPESLAYHRRRLLRRPGDAEWRRDTLALACVVGELDYARQLLRDLPGLTPQDRAAYLRLIEAEASSDIRPEKAPLRGPG